uniref:rhomboid protease n=1 Tax=Eucampia antarctica TaxID=49252 RepID=A0A6U0S1P1_9STRA|mmetsp:Transcript_24592/g.23628  ORF Transcript_24592/g.23628 Transcript_24592/m.23628 type:complete len:344 (+) Transcript_24592:45-1076(+)|eukprot:CAMPEP_0197833614 /NCGR_PEP_ID=MMETSP1437-20131217/19567_1 /TAXON_ID=49252 ORGANISM="Eucampia antarctica, Strain CCMP1452" /NCGR_SAMPLE_ID=MMETSP1437 /ASSEMBLY_ACC=CAM_ASM_001096 /LENGTH=343 /DNA_ID=CAMNT_0043437765 /DNA_START=21 /DNA_END=1052 /DNA_ORIENTATION=+
MQEPTSKYSRRSDNTGTYDVEKNNHADRSDYDDDNDDERNKKFNDGIEEDDDGMVNLLDHYEFRQSYGYFSILFSLTQVAILATMMLECGIAPLNINPMIGPYPDVMSYWGAKNALKILDDGENWRLLTPVLLHAGILHLIGNVHVQWDLGVFFEKEWGSAAWLIVYLTSGVGSSILSVYCMPDNISVGSSGAIMGLFGAKLSEIFVKWYEPRETILEKVGHAVRKEQLCMVSGGVVLVMLLSFIPYVDWAAHLGGLLSGIAVGMVVFSIEKRNRFWRSVWLLVGIGLTTLYFWKTIQLMYSGVEPMQDLEDVCAYYQQYFEDYECTCVLRGDDGSGDNDSGD